MPKNTKKKREKATDFTKAKLKLGRGKVQPTNAVDTSFKARSIVLPTQSIITDKNASEPLTKRHLGFGDLLSDLKHYNAGTRKDAILGLKELLNSNWDLTKSQLTPLLSALARLIGDEDAGVRKHLISFFAWLLPKVPKDDISPHSALLILFTTSAQTHIFPEIRIDAIRILDILLECVPEAVTAGWSDSREHHGSRVLGGYLSILNAGTRNGKDAAPTAGTNLTLASKLTVLRSLSTFLYVCLSSREDEITERDEDALNKPLHAWFMRGAFSSSEAFQSFDGLFTSKQPRLTRHWRDCEYSDEVEERDLFSKISSNEVDEPWTLDDLASLDSSDFSRWSSQSTCPEFVAHLAGILHSTIIETYLDSAPAVFLSGSNPPETELRLVSTTIHITQWLYRYMIQNLRDQIDTLHIDHLLEIVTHMTPYFPAENGDNIATRQTFEELNVLFCSLTSLVLEACEISPPSLRSTQMKRRSKRNLSSFVSDQATRVAKYITRRLNSSTVTSSGTAVLITPVAYVTLLPSIWAFMYNSMKMDATEGGDQSHNNGSTGLLHAVLDHAVELPSKSPCQKLSVEFVGKIFLLDTSPYYTGPNIFRNYDLSLQGKLETWLLHLPQVLWELGSSNIPLTEIILRVLLRTLQRRPQKFAASHSSSRTLIDSVAHSNTISYHTLTSLEARLIPYFFVNHPTHGSLAGPFGKLSSTSSIIESSKKSPVVCFLALDVVITLLSCDKRSISGVVSKEAAALETAVMSSFSIKNTMAEENAMSDLKQYWEDINRYKRDHCHIVPAQRV